MEVKDSLSFYISLIRRCFTKYCTEELAQMDVGVTNGQVFVLLYIGKHENCAPKELARALGMDPGHLNRTIARLSEKGFLSQKKNERDRRANILSLTEKGQDVFRKSYELFFQWDDLAFYALSPQEKEELLSLLKKASLGMIQKFSKEEA